MQAITAEKDAFLGALSNAEVPFPKLVEALGVPRSPMHTPVFQAIVAINENISATCGSLEAVEILTPVCWCFNILIKTSGLTDACSIKLASCLHSHCSFWGFTCAA